MPERILVTGGAGFIGRTSFMPSLQPATMSW
jgi:nucleoside-diphosphate-sugar epimerase